MPEYHLSTFTVQYEFLYFTTRALSSAQYQVLVIILIHERSKTYDQNKAMVVTPNALLVGASGGDFCMIAAVVANVFLNCDSMKFIDTIILRKLFIIGQKNGISKLTPSRNACNRLRVLWLLSEKPCAHRNENSDYLAGEKKESYP